MIVAFAGGKGDQDPQTFNTPTDIINFNGGAPAGNGQKGIGVLNVGAGQCDAFIYNPTDGFNGLVTLTPADLTSLGLDSTTTYQLHYFDNDEGGWGWGQLDLVHVAGGTALVPEPSTFVLAALGLLGLLGWGRRRRR